jgi:hypothetical protein
MELEAPALVTLANGENYFRKLQTIKKNYKRNSKNKTAIKPNVRQRNCRLSPFDHI